MLDKVTYPLNVSLIRMNLTTPNSGMNLVPGINVRETRTGHGTFQLKHTETPLWLIYQLDSLYIEGFINKNNEVFVTNNSTYSNSPNKILPYGNEYGELGLDRTSEIYVTLDNVNGAVDGLGNAATNGDTGVMKKYLRIICIAFAEAVRFDDVLIQVINGEAITDLDWTKHKNPSKVRVVQHA